MSINNEITYINNCRDQIRDKLGWTVYTNWRESEFIELSERIFDATSVQLSTTTLKRFFGKVKYDSAPSSATLNALAGFLGYKSWMEFSLDQVTTKASSLENNLQPRKKFNSKPVYLLAVSATLILVIVSGFAFLKDGSSDKIDPDKIIFTSKAVTLGLPNSVIFKTDLQNIQSDNILIQQSWDSTRTIQLKPGQKEATGIYYIPGYFRAKLIVDKKIIKEHDLFIRSNGWMATVEGLSIPDYVAAKDLILDGALKVSDKILEKIKQERNQTYLTYHLVQPFKDLHSDNFIFESSFKNTFHEGQAVCGTIKVFILCTNGAFIIPFTIPGCVSDINLKLGNMTWPGKSTDLSIFGTDVFKKLNLRLEVMNKNVSIFLNNRLLKKEKYTASAGDIVGLRFSFLGAGEVNALSFTNEKGIKVYEEDFTN